METNKLQGFYIMLITLIFLSLYLPTLKNENEYMYNQSEIDQTYNQPEMLDLDVKQISTPQVVIQNNMCPSESMGNAFHGSYERSEGESFRTVCDYKGQVTDTECEQEGAMLVSAWCQKLLQEDTFLLSVKREQ